MLALGYSTQRGYANTHPFAGEIRQGTVVVEVVPEELGFAIDIGEISVIECQMVNQFAGSATELPQFTRGYGLVFGACERKAMAMALVDRSLRAEHRLHVRCESPTPNAVRLSEPFLHNPRVQLLSLMDHTPGQRQWTNVEQARIYYTGKKGWSDEKFAHVVDESKMLQQQYAEPHRRFFLEHARSHGIPLASHDDTTPQHTAEARDAGIAVSEFPTTLDAARAAREQGIGIVMGAPNVVRGGSHSGNISAATLAADGLLDVLSSDYVPASLLSAAFILMDKCGFSVAQAVATISANPAGCAGLADRGEIAVDKRADFSRVRLVNGMPSVIGVWRGAKCIA